MSVNLSDLGGRLLGWLRFAEGEKNTSKLEEHVRTCCCGKPYESRETAIGQLVNLSDILSEKGFYTESSELQILIAEKVEELAKEPLAAASAPKAAVIESSIKAAVIPSNPVDRKRVFIEREKQEIDAELQAAEGLENDDPEIRALRKTHFNAYKVALDQLLEKVEAAKAEVLPPKETKKIEPVADEAPKTADASAPEAEPKAQDSKPKAPEEAPIEPEAERKTPVEEPKALTSKVDPELLTEMKTREEKIAALQAELTIAQSEKNQRLVQSLGENLSSEVEELDQLKQAILS